MEQGLLSTPLFFMNFIPDDSCLSLPRLDADPKSCLPGLVMVKPSHVLSNCWVPGLGLASWAFLRGPSPALWCLLEASGEQRSWCRIAKAALVGTPGARWPGQEGP